jgi:RimJ/RimL family protein N-acetyltransferase
MSTFIFKALEDDDLGLLCAWFNKSHVREWWDDHLTNEEIKLKYRKRIGDPVTLPFIAYLDEKPIGFIQYYFANKIENNDLLDEMDDTVGLDQFIGEEDYINRGYGTQMIGQFVDHLFSDASVRKILIDVNKNNQRAIRCYEKLGFSFSGETIGHDRCLVFMSKFHDNYELD